MKRIIIYIICLCPFTGLCQSPFEKAKTLHYQQTNRLNDSSGRVIHFCAQSLVPGKHPLYVVDGTICGSLKINNIDPDDIKEIKVLQAKEATIIYGTEGANGAILLFTKTAGLKIFCGDYNNMIL